MTLNKNYIIQRMNGNSLYGLYVPNNIDQYLKTHFGDYMKLPPKELRYGHRPYKVEL